MRSSGVRHRKWIRLGVKLPDFTVGMSSHCIIRGYSLSLASVKREGETPPSLPVRRFWAAILLNDDVCGTCDDDDSRNNDGARKCNLDHARFDRDSGTATHGVSRPGTARLSCRPGLGPFFYDLSVSAACMEDQV